LLLRSLELAVEVVLLWRHASPSLGPHGAAPDRNHRARVPALVRRNHRRAYPDILAEGDPS
jgi:hypothetical protein